jgi:hypothetical protein
MIFSLGTGNFIYLLVFLIGLFFHVDVEVDGRRGREDVGKKAESREQREVSSLLVNLDQRRSCPRHPRS